MIKDVGSDRTKPAILLHEGMLHEKRSIKTDLLETENTRKDESGTDSRERKGRIIMTKGDLIFLFHCEKRFYKYVRHRKQCLSHFHYLMHYNIYLSFWSLFTACKKYPQTKLINIITYRILHCRVNITITMYYFAKNTVYVKVTF